MCVCARDKAHGDAFRHGRTGYRCATLRYAFCYALRCSLADHYRNQPLRRVPQALGEALKTLGKGFAECNTRQRRLGKQYIGKDFFAEFQCGSLRFLHIVSHNFLQIL
jgi:hypothetical protein